VAELTRVLVTGFEPFAEATLNSSQEVVRLLEKEGLSEVFFEVLPVEYESSVDRILALIDKVNPEIIFALGQAEGRARVSLERIAINLNDARIPDNSGTIRLDQPILEAGDVAYKTSLPVRQIVERLKDQGLPVEESLSAGAFVCNHLFYSVMHHLQGSKRRWMDFVHLPLVSEQSEEFLGKPTLEKEMQAGIIKAAIKEARALWQR